MNLGLIFLTGLTTGGLTCLSVQGGLLASVIAHQKKGELANNQSLSREISFNQLDWLPVGLFLITKLIAHAILGFLLGALGSVLQLSAGVSLMFQLLAALFMIATAMNLLQVHPLFRYVSLQPPYFLQKYIRRSTKREALFAPALLGALTVFIPCGVTQAMEVQAINSGNALVGATILGVFVLGTIPIFSLIGIATSTFSEIWNKRFLNFAAVILIFMGLYGINGVLQVLDAPITFQKIRDEIILVFSPIDSSKINGSAQATGIQRITIEVKNNGYSPSRVQAKVGQPVELTLKTSDTFSCASAFRFREFDIQAQLKPTDTQTFRFTPTRKGKFTFSCSMGMYSGVMEVL